MEKVLDTHLELRHVLDALEGNPEQATDAIERLARLLPDHFRLEEDPGGFLDRLRARGATEAQIARLRSEHVGFLDAIATLRREADHPDRGALLDELTRALRAHEWEESRLAATPDLLDPEHDPDRDPRW